MSKASLTAELFELPKPTPASNAILGKFQTVSTLELQEAQDKSTYSAPETGESILTPLRLVPRNMQNSATHEAPPLEGSQAGKVAQTVKSLVEDGFINDARRLLGQHQRIQSAKLDRWRRLLAPAVVSESDKAPAPNFPGNQEWIKKNSSSFVGKWVALRDGALVDADESRSGLCRRLKTEESLTGILLVKIYK